ncbi:MAG: hypothetical protein FD179_1613 [Erysipelotrichaceae bacterium]|nr:MAG: hypothetical protein FD179_1613 [Erysipelotrichaceae bacterium]
MKKDNINLLDNYLLSEKKRKNQGSKSLNIVAVFLVTVLLLSAYSLSLFLQDKTLRESNAELTAYVNNPTTLAQIRDITVKQRQLADLKEILVELKSLNAAFGAMPEINSEVVNKINSCLPPDTKILTIDFDGQWFTLKTQSVNYLRPSEFARNLRNTGFFEEVNYYGYDDDAGKYIGNVLVAMKVGN